MLLLRQSAQPILDQIGLSELHVTINNKCLTIVGPCGQPVVSISGIQFARSTVSADERDFATELFAKFITKHGKAIIEYVSARQQFNALAKPALPDGAYSTGNNSGLVYVTFPTDFIQSDRSSKNNMSIYADGNISFNVTVDMKKMLYHLPQLTQMMEDTEKYISSLDAYKKEENRLNEMKMTISSCTI